MRFRVYENKDAGQILRLFADTVHIVNAADYTKPQLNAWAPDTLDADAWCTPLAQDYTLVAVEGETIVGFGSLTVDGCLDRLYVHKDHQRRGIATQIMDALEENARDRHLESMESYVSQTAKPFFLGRGYVVVRENTVVRQGELLTNYLMKKML